MPINDPVELTRALIAHNTVTGTCGVQFVKWLVETLRQLGFSTKTVDVEGLSHVVATIGPETSLLKLGFLGHYDTVPAGEGWTHSPFRADVENGTIYGRGASDMKSGDAAMITAAAALAKQGLHITVLLPGDEETRSEGMPALLDSLPYKLDFCIGGEPTSKQELGDCIKIGRRGVLQGRIKLLGVAGHAAYAERTKNILNSMPFILDALAKPWHDSRHGVETTLAVTAITTESGAINVIPGSVTLTFDARFAPQRTTADIEAEISRRLVATSIPFELSIVKRTDPYVSDSSDEANVHQRALVDSARRAVREVTGREPSLLCDGGTSDARFAAQRGIPTVEFGVPHGNMHGPDEFVTCENVALLERVYIRIGELLASTWAK